jgi:hypothetical protein
MSNFFKLRSKLLNSTIQVHSVGLDIIPDPCRKNFSDHNRLIIGNYEGIDFPVNFKYESGKIFRDILDTGWHILYLISDKLKHVLEISKITGWKTFPIKIYDKK